MSVVPVICIAEKSRAYYLITFSAMLATIMQVLDSTIANVALSHIQGSLLATQDQIAWILTSYIVASAIMIPLAGWLSGFYGRRKVFLISIVSFIITSILCGIAKNLPEMILFRLLQGIAGAALVPLSQSILLSINTKKNYGKAMALWGVGVTLGPILGPLLGGWLTENYNWRWIFFINIPIGMVALGGLYFFLPETETQKSRFDFFGFFTLSLAIGALQLFLDRGQFKDWFSSTEIIIEAIVAGLGFYLFFIHILSFRNPFLNLQLFKDRNFVTASLLIFIIGIVLFATLVLIPPMLQHQLNYPVFEVGVVTAPRGIGIMLTMLIAGRMLEKIDGRIIIAIGLLIIAFSLRQMTQFSLYIDSWAIMSSGFIQGLGIGLAYIGISSAAFFTLPGHLQNEGTAFFNLMRSLGSSVGISIVELFLIRNTQIMHATLTEHIMPYNPLLNMAYTAGHIDTVNLAGVSALNAMITNQAAMVAYIDDYYLMMIMTLMVIPLLFLLRKKED